MIYQRLVALFVRYASVHLDVGIAGAPLTDGSGDILGHVDRVTLRGQRLVVDGWADADTLVLCHAGQQQVLVPNLPRADVAAAHPAGQMPSPGFSCSLPKDGDAATLTLIRDGVHFVYPVPLPQASKIARARLVLILPFLRDLFRAAPILLHWVATHDPDDRVRLKRRLRLQPRRRLRKCSRSCSCKIVWPAWPGRSETMRWRACTQKPCCTLRSRL